MTISDITEDVRSKHWLRMPVSDTNENTELFVFTGVGLFDELKGTGSSWDGGTAVIKAGYRNVIPDGQAILLQHWTVDIQLASVFNANEANNTGWSVNSFSLVRIGNDVGPGPVAVPDGVLRTEADIALRDSDAFILRLAYHVTILGTVVDFRPPPIE